MTKFKNNPIQLFAAPRCGAKTRRGTACQSPAVYGKQRCRMHGGAVGSGAPKGNTNALKHGAYRGALLNLKKQAREVLKELRRLVA